MFVSRSSNQIQDTGSTILASSNEEVEDIPGLEISNFAVTKHRFLAKHVRGTYFENGFRKEKS